MVCFPAETEPPLRGLGGRSTSGVGCGRRTKNSIALQAPLLAYCLYTAFTYLMRALRRFAQLSSQTLSN